VEAIRIDRLAHTHESVGIELVRVWIEFRIMMDSVGGKLEDRASRKIQAVFEGMGFHGNALASDYIWVRKRAFDYLFDLLNPIGLSLFDSFMKLSNFFI
jgi:hypothetical protein